MNTSAKSLLTTVKNLGTASLIMGGLVYGLSPQQDTTQVYYGLLHAHTMISDGSGTPEEAYNVAKENKLDFFAVTPHNHEDAESGAKERRDNVLIATNHALYNGTSLQTVTRQWKENNTTKSETITVKPLLQAAADATTPAFVAIYGQEFSTISSGNHINVLGIDEVITTPNGDFKALINMIKRLPAQGKQLPIIQLNHPDVSQDVFYNGNEESTKNKMFNDYGLDESDFGPHFKDLSETLNPYISLIEILSGPAMKKDRVENYRYDTHENDYFFYLKQGLRVSPSAGQDNHYKTWGNVTDARMGVMAEKLTQESLFSAMRQGRTFVTEDKNLQAIFYINNQLMGSSITAAEETELKINVRISDEDEPDATYKVILYGGEINPELSTRATNWKASDGKLEEILIEGDNTYAISGIFASAKPWFIYAKIIQEDDDRAWTAPVWINTGFSSATPVAGESRDITIYYWTKTASSTVYHQYGCSSVNRIKLENLVSSQTPPPGRSLHDCNVAEENGH